IKRPTPHPHPHSFPTRRSSDLPSGAGVCEFRLATNENWTDKNGQRQERTEWHRVVVWGKKAESCSKYLSKGRQVFVEGRLRTRRSEEHTSELQSREKLVCRLLP